MQSGDDHVLQRMKRQYNSFEFSRMVSAVRGQIPELAVTTDVIVGFPGETEEEFENTFDQVKDIGFSKTHVFKYSPRRGTPAATYSDQVPAHIKDARSKRLITLDRENQRKFASRFIGESVEVLAEQLVEVERDVWGGLTDNYLRVLFKSDEDIQGEFVEVRTVKLRGTNLLAKTKV